MLDIKYHYLLFFRLLGIESDKDIMKYILYNLDTEKSSMFIEDLEKSVVDTGPIFTQMDALRYVANLTKGSSMSHILRYFKN